MRYLLRRMLHAVFLLFGVSILTFLFSTLAPGNYFDEMRLNLQIAPETVASLRAISVGPAAACALRPMGEFGRAGPDGIFLCLQQPRWPASLGAGTEHAAPHSDGDASCLGTGPAPRNLVRRISWTLAGPRPLVDDGNSARHSGSRSCARIADHGCAQRMVSDRRHGLCGV